MNGNLFGDLPATLMAQEHVECLLSTAGVRIERIVSNGQASPPGFWYEQPEAEWVVLLTGAASLRFEDESHVRQMAPGDWFYIATGRRHRVDRTDPAILTVWLAVHFPE